MDIADLAGPGRTPACWDKPAVFAARALDYTPRGEEYAHLDLLGHTMLADRKRAAEEAAVDVCFGCPLMLACEKIDEQNIASGKFIAGVIGGRTEGERRARHRARYGRTTTETLSTENPQIAPGDRGPRNQVDDELVARMTRAGKTSEQIAEEIGCSPRTVSRARRRMHLTTPKGAANQPAHDTEPFAAHAVEATSESIARTEQAIATAATHSARPRPVRKSAPARVHAQPPVTSTANPFTGRPISAYMEAVYNHLAAVGGTDTLANLLAVGIPHVDPEEGLDWWTKHNSTTVNGIKTIRPSKSDTPVQDRIHEGARAKVLNAVSATHRKGRYLDRTGDTFTFKPHALRAWTEREAAATTVAA